MVLFILFKVCFFSVVYRTMTMIFSLGLYGFIINELSAFLKNLIRLTIRYCKSKKKVVIFAFW